MKLVNVETPEKNVCKMTFSASAAELEEASEAVYQRTRDTFTIKGFAKGQADRAQIESRPGRARLLVRCHQRPDGTGTSPACTSRP